MAFPIWFPRFLVLLGASLLIFVVPIFFLDIVGFNEAQDGLRVHALVSSGQEGIGSWLFPSVRKPPLFYWLGATLAWLQGGVVDAVSIRLPSALFATAGVLVTWWLGSRIVASAAYPAAFILLTSPLYVEQGRIARPDMALCFFVTLSLAVFFLIYQQQVVAKRLRLAWLPCAPYVCGLSCLGAVLSKGPVGGILIVLPILAFAAWLGELRALRLMLKPALFVLVLASGWYAGAMWWYPKQLWSIQIGEENLGRFFGGIDVMSPGYYLDVIFLRFAPWSLCLPVAVWQAFRSRQQGPVFLALWWTTITVFFHLAAYKRARYLLPMFPPAALLVGWWLSTRREVLSSWLQRAPWWPTGVKLAGVAGSVVIAIGFSVLASSQSDQPTACRLVMEIIPPRTAAQTVHYCEWLGAQLGLSLTTWVGLTVGGGALFLALLRMKLSLAFGLGVIQLIVFYALIQPSWLMIDSRVRSPQQVVQQVLEKTRESGQIFLITPLTTTEDPDVPAVFHIQKNVQVITVWWPSGQPPAILGPGYYLVPVRRQQEILAYPYGQWQAIAIEKEGEPWSFVLLAYSGPPSYRVD